MPTEAEIIETLLRRGWSAPVDHAHRQEVTDAVRTLLNPEFCGCTLQLNTEEIGQRYCPWPEPEIRWHIRHAIPNLGLSAMRASCEAALAGLSAAFELDFPYAESASDANIIIEVHNLGGPMGVLADCQLVPCGTRQNRGTQMLMRVDRNEQWVVANTPSGMAVDFQRVFLHEWLHGLGLPHITTPRSLMLPTYSTTIRTIQDGDIAALEQLGYRRRTKPVEPKPSGGKKTTELFRKDFGVGAFVALWEEP